MMIGDPFGSSGVLERGLLLKPRFAGPLRNLRPGTLLLRPDPQHNPGDY